MAQILDAVQWPWTFLTQLWQFPSYTTKGASSFVFKREKLSLASVRVEPHTIDLARLRKLTMHWWFFAGGFRSGVQTQKIAPMRQKTGLRESVGRAGYSMPVSGSSMTINRKQNITNCVSLEAWIRISLNWKPAVPITGPRDLLSCAQRLRPTKVS